MPCVGESGIDFNVDPKAKINSVFLVGGIFAIWVGRGFRKSCCIFTASIRPITTTVSMATPHRSHRGPLLSQISWFSYGITIGKGGRDGAYGGSTWPRMVGKVRTVRIVADIRCW